MKFILLLWDATKYFKFKWTVLFNIHFSLSLFYHLKTVDVKLFLFRFHSAVRNGQCIFSGYCQSVFKSGSLIGYLWIDAFNFHWILSDWRCYLCDFMNFSLSSFAFVWSVFFLVLSNELQWRYLLFWLSHWHFIHVFIYDRIMVAFSLLSSRRYTVAFQSQLSFENNRFIMSLNHI